MKGIVFTEFLEMVEEMFGLETVDNIIEGANLKSGGIYTSVGTYDFIEMQELLTRLSKVKNIPINDLIYTYGLYFFKILLAHHPDIFDRYENPLLFIASVENHIHVEVRKIYPGAELPSFGILVQENNYLEIIYTSERAMYMFAKALIQKSFEYYNKDVKINYDLLKADGTQVKFMISMENGSGKTD